MSDECCGPITPAGSTPPEPLVHEDLPPWWRDRALALPVASGVLWISGLILEWTGGESSTASITATILFALGLAAGAWTFVPGTIERLIKGKGRSRLGVGLLMTIAAIGAVLLGHVGEAAALAFLFSIAETLEDRAMDRAKHGLRALLSLVPETARVRRGSDCTDGCCDYTDQTIPASDVRIGDTLLIGAGERIPTDGTVATGQSWVDTSAITGESIPVGVDQGNEVLAGSVNGSGTLTVTATADGGDNSLTQIVRLVEQAHATKGERARLADRIARPLVPLVLVAAALIAGIGALLGDPGVWVERALVVLVAASPCALAIAVPVTVISAIDSASKFGVVIKSGEAFEQFGTIRTVAFDKTGTLTRNEPRVVEVRSSGNRSELDVLTLAAALEASSSHPLAQAVTTAVPVTVGAREFPQVTTVHEEPGHGMSGILHPTLAGHPDDLDGDDSGLPVRVGGPRWIDPADMATDTEEMARQGMSLIVVEVDGEVHGVIGIRDELRPEAAETIAALHAQDVTTMMLTGDNERTATALATDAGIDRIHADQLPSDKARHVQESAAHIPTAMIGDGINDAPALATATVGIAMGASGSAAAIESADIAFTGNDLRLIPAALAHASRGRRIMTGNIILALAIIVVLFPLALFGVLGLTAVVLVHEIAEVVVIGNGLRAARSSDVVRSPTTPTTQATSPA